MKAGDRSRAAPHPTLSPRGRGLGEGRGRSSKRLAEKVKACWKSVSANWWRGGARPGRGNGQGRRLDDGRRAVGGWEAGLLSCVHLCSQRIGHAQVPAMRIVKVTFFSFSAAAPTRQALTSCASSYLNLAQGILDFRKNRYSLAQIL
jgi:hypothetical protein